MNEIEIDDGFEVEVSPTFFGSSGGVGLVEEDEDDIEQLPQQDDESTMNDESSIAAASSYISRGYSYVASNTKWVIVVMAAAFVVFFSIGVGLGYGPIGNSIFGNDDASSVSSAMAVDFTASDHDDKSDGGAKSGKSKSDKSSGTKAGKATLVPTQSPSSSPTRAPSSSPSSSPTGSPTMECFESVDITSPTQELTSTGQQFDFVFPNLQEAVGDIQVQVNTRGDINSPDIDRNDVDDEFYVVTAEGNVGLGNTGNNPQCSLTYRTDTFTIPQADFNNYISGDGELTIEADATAGVDCCCGNDDVFVKLVYTSVCTGSRPRLLL